MSEEHEDPRPQKRIRTMEEGSSVASVQDAQALSSDNKLDSLTRHEEFWFEDGSVVLMARNTGFRVFRSLLAAQSTVFADMLSSSSPRADEMVAGCPVVHLSDSPQDVAHFLGVLLPKSRRTLFTCNPRFSFRRISAIVRLAHKYHVQDVLDQAILALEQYFASDFDAWENGNRGIAVVFKPRHAVAVINLARLVDKPSMLPMALYKCALLGGGVFNGYKHKDKSVEHLAQSDIVRCVDGRNKLAAKAVALVSEVFIMDPCARCERRGRCKSALKTMLDAIGSDDASDPDVLNGGEDAIKEWAKALRLCGPCEKAALDRDTAARRRVWDELPEIFGIKVEGWNSTGVDSGEGGAAPAGT